MNYLLDTNACIAVMSNTQPKVAQRLALAGAANVALCSIVKAELYYGACHSQRQASNLLLIDIFCRQYASLPFDDLAAEMAGREMARLAFLGTPIGPNDLLIGAIALANNLTMVTHNTREFSRIAGLRLEDWEL